MAGFSKLIRFECLIKKHSILLIESITNMAVVLLFEVTEKTIFCNGPNKYGLTIESCKQVVVVSSVLLI